jgi:hypothetical protein
MPLLEVFQPPSTAVGGAAAGEDVRRRSLKEAVETLKPRGRELAHHQLGRWRREECQGAGFENGPLLLWPLSERARSDQVAVAIRRCCRCRCSALAWAFWPRSAETGTPEQPVVLLEVQMHAKPGVKHRLGAQSFRFLQLYPHVQHLAVVVVVPHRRLNMGPAERPQQLQRFLMA